MEEEDDDGNMFSYVETFQRICFPCKLNSQCFRILALLGTGKDYEDGVDGRTGFVPPFNAEATRQDLNMSVCGLC